MIHTEISPSEVADRTTIRELVDAYAHCADWRDAEGQRPMLTEDTQFVACMDGQGSHPAQVLDASEALTSVFDDLNRYQATVLDGFRRGEAFGEEDAVDLSKRAHGWATSLPFDVIVESFHVSARRFVALVTESASELELDAALVLAVQDRAWEWAMFAARVIADVQRQQAVAAARRDASRRAEFLRDLALGQVTAARLVEESAVYGLDAAQPYFGVVALCDDPAGSALEARIRESGATSTHRVLQATIDGRLLALTPRRPKAPPGATVAVGPPVALSDVHDSFVEAEEALAAATAFGIAGTVDLTSVGPLTLVTVADRVAARLADRYFGDLGEGFSEVEDTVRTLLDHNQSIEETAAAMHLHRNTVRYRVARFRDMTGLDIRRTHDLVTAWWLLEWRRARTRSRPRRGE